MLAWTARQPKWFDPKDTDSSAAPCPEKYTRWALSIMLTGSSVADRSGCS